MKEIIEAFEKIIEHKAKLMCNNTKYEEYIKEVLKKQGIRRSNEIVKVFKMGAVDGMIFDIGAASNFTRWKRYNRRKEMLLKIFSR